jgi:hypothetical protein
MIAAMAVAAALAAQTPSATLPTHCTDQQVAPATVTIACADDGFIISGLAWPDWGAAKAHASGTATINTCDPNCAAGNAVQRAIAVTAKGLEPCWKAQPQYTRLSWTFPDGTRPGSGAFPCPRAPRIETMRLSTRLVGRQVHERVRMRLCGPPGRSRVVLKQTKSSGNGIVFARGTRALRYRQASGCHTRTFSYPLALRFFGVGVYRVAATVHDSHGQTSRTVTRRVTTTD